MMFQNNCTIPRSPYETYLCRDEGCTSRSLDFINVSVNIEEVSRREHDIRLHREQAKQK